MQKEYQAPELTLIGQAHEVVMGMSGGTDDLIGIVAPDFEFEED
jgi:hypothetical protein